MDTATLASILQASLSPVLLISGGGLILLSLTNRVARPIDLIRQLLEQTDGASAEERRQLLGLVMVLYRRCRYLRTAIALTVAAIFFTGVLTLLLFTVNIYSMHLFPALSALFVLGVLCLIGALVFYLLDVRLALHAVKAHIAKAFPDQKL